MDWKPATVPGEASPNVSAAFKYFDLLIDIPGAVKALRSCILQLAVSGKLVEQSHSDEPATALLEVLKAERTQLIRAKKIKARHTSIVTEAEQPFAIPSTWAWARLADVGHDLGQKVPDKTFTYIDVGGIDSERGQLSDRLEQIHPDSAPSRARKLVTHGTVIYSTVRPYLLNVAIVDQDFESAPIASTAFGILHPFKGVLNRYLFYWLRSPPFIDYVNSEMKGMAYPAINDANFYGGHIPLPPLAEQKRIVAKVDELMGLCDRLEAEQAERQTRHATLTRAALARFADEPTVENLRWLFHESFEVGPEKLRKTVLTLAVQGKLVPQDPNNECSNEPFGALLDSNTKNSPQIGEPPFVLPAGWKWLRIENVFDVAGGIQKSPRRAPKSNSFPYLGVRNVYRGRLDLTDVKEFELEPGEIERRRLEAGDLLVIEGNGSINEIGRCARWNGEIKNCVHQNHVIRCRPVNKKLTDFVLLYLNSPSGIEVMQRLAITSSGLYSLSVGKIRKIEIPVPPLPEQKRIVAKVNQLMALIDELEQQLTESRAKAEKLMETVVAGLVSQS